MTRTVGIPCRRHACITPNKANGEKRERGTYTKISHCAIFAPSIPSPFFRHWDDKQRGDTATCISSSERFHYDAHVHVKEGKEEVCGRAWSERRITAGNFFVEVGGRGYSRAEGLCFFCDTASSLLNWDTQNMMLLLGQFFVRGHT